MALSGGVSRLPLDEFAELDRKRREVIGEAEEKKALRNLVSDEIAAAKKSGDDASDKIAAMKKVGEEIKALDTLLRDIESQLDDIVLELPNTPLPEAPDGVDESDNVELRRIGEPRSSISSRRRTGIWEPIWGLSTRSGAPR